MKIDTTININKKHMGRINEASLYLKLSRSEVILYLIDSFIKNGDTNNRVFQRVRYQKRGLNPDWHRFHVSLSCDMYEKCLDLRKTCKMSVSFIVAVAISLYIDEIIRKANNNTDNYCGCYIYIQHNIPNSFGYSILWQIPEDQKGKKLLKLLL